MDGQMHAYIHPFFTKWTNWLTCSTSFLNLSTLNQYPKLLCVHGDVFVKEKKTTCKPKN